MKIYRIATPSDVIDVGHFMADQSDDDRNMYYGYNMRADAVVPMYEKVAANLSSQSFVVVKEPFGKPTLGFIHLARSGERIELGIYVDPEVRNQGIGRNLLAMAMLYTFTLMGRDMEMQCVNRNYDIRKLISEYDKTTDIYAGEQVAVVHNTINNQSKAIGRLGRAMWNF
jgi:GNAT superfamily N-acetyltransferase